MAWPNDRLTTYAAGAQLKSADLNAIQDATIDGGQHGDRQKIIGAGAGQIGLATWVFLGLDGSSIPPHFLTPGIGDTVIFDLGLRIGDRIKSVHAYIQDTAASNFVAMELRHGKFSDASNVIVGTRQTSAGDGTKQTLTVTATRTIVDGDFFNMAIAADTATQTTSKVYGVSVLYDHP